MLPGLQILVNFFAEPIELFPTNARLRDYLVKVILWLRGGFIIARQVFLAGFFIARILLIGKVRGVHSAPLVEGIPLTRGSVSTAPRSARATALNCASTIWCGSRPASTSTCRQMPAL